MVPRPVCFSTVAKSKNRHGGKLSNIPKKTICSLIECCGQVSVAMHTLCVNVSQVPPNQILMYPCKVTELYSFTYLMGWEEQLTMQHQQHVSDISAFPHLSTGSRVVCDGSLDGRLLDVWMVTGLAQGEGYYLQCNFNNAMHPYILITAGAKWIES